jgi:phosphoheptose isomerase
MQRDSVTSKISKYVQGHVEAIESLSSQHESIEQASDALIASIKSGNKILLCGNGGSASDAQHIAAELVGRFGIERHGLPAIALTTDTSILTSVGNDYGFEHIFARQVEALAGVSDVLVAISTSGNSSNVINCVNAAKKVGCQTIGLLGRDGGELSSVVDISIVVPVYETAYIQECHIVIGHIWCSLIDDMIAKRG